MLNRYSTKQIRDIWSLESRFQAWLKIELLVCEYWNRVGEIPENDWKNIQKKSKIYNSKSIRN